MKELIKKLFKTGFFSIYISTIFSKVITLFGGIIIVRILSKNDYSNYALVTNAFAMLTFFGDFGSSSATLQFAIEEKNNSKKQSQYYILGLKIAMSASILSSILIATSKFYYPFNNNIVKNYLLMLFLIPILTTLINFINVILRVNEKNNKYSIYQFSSTFIHYLIVIIFTFSFGLLGSLIAQYFYNIIIIIIGIFLIWSLIRKNFVKCKDAGLTKNNKKNFIKLSFGSQINNTITNLLYTVDVFIIGLLIKSGDGLALYKVATVIPTALSFLPQCLIVYLYPYFVKNNKNKLKLKEYAKKTIKYSAIIYGFITIIFCILSKYILLILYGKEYIDAAYPFSLLMVAFFINSTVKITLSNMLYSMHKVNINIIISIIGVIVNFILNYLLVKFMGYIGAAYATIFVSILMSVLNLYYLNKTFKGME